MLLAGLAAALAVTLSVWPTHSAAATSIAVNVSAITDTVTSDWTATFYATREPLLLGNDGAPDTGGIRAYSLDSTPPLREHASVVVGRTKLVTVVYDVGGKDLAITIAQPDSIMRVFELPELVPINDAQHELLGDWSALCAWKSKTGNQYVYLFGKHQAVQLLLRTKHGKTNIVEVQTFGVPFEASSCATAESTSQMYLSSDHDKAVYAMPMKESTAPPEITRAFNASDDVTGLAVYVGSGSDSIHHVFVASDDAIAVFDQAQNLVGTLDVVGYKDIELQGLGIYQASTSLYPQGFISYAMEAKQATGFGTTSLDGVLQTLGVTPNTKYDPRHPRTCRRKSPPSFETDAAGGDGDDPAIWISPISKAASRIITTTKSRQGAGLSVFNLSGHLLQTVSAGEPNNVDIIYSFRAGNRTIDLAFAACREDDTLCFFEMLPNGTLTTVLGGSQPVHPDFTVYGSCTYRSRTSGRQYLFVNEKSARYLQYELTSTPNGTLVTTLVRQFQGGSGGQVEGCVTDEENGWIFLGEEPSSLWRYGAEPESDSSGIIVAKVGDGHLYGDVEGVTLVVGRGALDGFVVVSCQGVSAYNIYRRAPPHEYVTTFSLVASSDGEVDAVSNTDGIAAVGTSLGPQFPFGLLVTHDDANQLPNGTTSPLASFKITSLETILGAEQVQGLRLLDQVDTDWDPRASARA
ncbi:PhyL [Purpureocillium lavendulum]|uniref:PhyL n=1 Tax=Purpureocillium lavendulum TaxID=1247861 RepID=A0AB34G0H4_9HYPO|nr:PhyL [Purpureocillium lavendulum]